MKRFFPLACLLVLLFLATGCHSLQKKEQLLGESGFRAITPSTPAQEAHLRTLPQGHLVPVNKHGKTLFLLADAKQNRLFIGNQSNYESYKQLRLQHQLSRDEAATTDLNADATVEWNAWGGLDSPLWSPEFP